MNPLILVALRGDIDAVGHLIAHGAEVNTTNRAGDTALMIAAIQGHYEVVRFLSGKSGPECEKRQRLDHVKKVDK